MNTATSSIAPISRAGILHALIGSIFLSTKGIIIKAAYGLMVLIAILCTVLPSFIIAEAISRIGPSLTAIIGTVGPISTGVLALWFLGETFTVWHLIGIFLCGSGVIFLTKRRKSSSALNTPSQATRNR